MAARVKGPPLDLSGFGDISPTCASVGSTPTPTAGPVSTKAPLKALQQAADEELKLLLTELKSKQKALVLPTLLSFGLALQTFMWALEPLRPLGWFGGVHFLSLFLFTLWQDVPDLGIARQRSQHRALAYLLLSSGGFAVCVASAMDELLLTMVLVFLLPITSTWEVRDMEPSQWAPFESYLALHFAMTCAQLRADFWQTGWKFCLVSLIFDLILLGCVTERRHMKKKLLDGTCSTVRRLLTAVCDACCVVSGTGEILLADMRVADLVGGPEALGLSSSRDLDSLPFNTLLQLDKDACGSSTAITEGTRIAKLKVCDGLPPAMVEIYTVRCSMSPEVINSVLGRKGALNVAGGNAFLCAIRQTASQGAPPVEPSPAGPRRFSAGGGGGDAMPAHLADAMAPQLSAGTLEQLRQSAAQASRTPSELSRPRLEEGTLEKLRAHTGSLGGPGRPSPKSCLGSEIGLSSQVGRGAVSEVGRASQVSGFSNASGSNISARHDNTSALTLANRRLQLMGNGRSQAAQLDRGTSMILEVDLPASEVSSVVSECVSSVHPGAASGAGVGVVPGPGASGGAIPASSPLNVRMRMQNKSSSRSLLSAVSSNADGGGASSSSGEEMETTEVRSIGAPSADGTVRVQLAFRSRCLEKQRARLDSSEMELRRARERLHVRDEMQEDQKAVLKKFQKIVTREFGNFDDGRPLGVTVFIFEARDSVREQLKELCEAAGYTCHVFKDAMTGKSLLLQESGLSEYGEGSVQEGWSSSTTMVPKRPAWRDECRTQLVLLGAPLIEQLRAEWREAGIFVALISMAEEQDELGQFLGASSEAELRDTLRALGVNEYVTLPLGGASLRGLAEGALRHRFGGDFLLVQHFGRGATGPVYGAKRLRDGKVFAIKEVNVSKVHRQSKGGAGSKAIAFEWKEVEVLASVKWPTVMNLIDHWEGNAGKLKYILMPALVGGTIQEQVDKATDGQIALKGDQVAEWYAQALHGLAYLHWCGVMHRDIKTDNLLLDINNRSIKIADFGSALLLPGPGPHPQRRNCVRGDVTTVRITSPEVFARRLWYSASDLWSLGATFFEVLALQPLLPADQPIDELLELAGAMDELPERGAAAAAAGDVASTRGQLPADLVASYAKLLRQAPPVPGLAGELPELLRSNPLRRPTAAALCQRPRAARDLRSSLEAGPLWERASRMRHLFEFDRLLSESHSAAELDPPDEATQLAAEEASAAEAAKR